MKTELLSKTKAELVQLMKRREEITVQEASSKLALAASTIRQHLVTLEKDGFVDIRYQRHGVGRPRKKYFLTEKSDFFFENRDRYLLSRLVEFLDTKGAKEELEAFFEVMGAELADTWQCCLADQSEVDELAELRTLFEDWGYAPRLKREDGDRLCIEFYHCPYAAIVDQVDAPCRLERNLLGRMLGGSVSQVSHMFEGGCCCRFSIEGFSGFDSSSSVDE